jgi:hypothetical protein
MRERKHPLPELAGDPSFDELPVVVHVATLTIASHTVAVRQAIHRRGGARRSERERERQDLHLVGRFRVAAADLELDDQGTDVLDES